MFKFSRRGQLAVASLVALLVWAFLLKIGFPPAAPPSSVSMSFKGGGPGDSSSTSIEQPLSKGLARSGTSESMVHANASLPKPDWIFSEFLLKKHQQAISMGAGGASRFQRECHLIFREARLFALAFPKEAEELSTRVALDRSAERETRLYCEFMLCTVAKSGSVSALTTLITLVHDSDPEISDSALSAVAETDPLGKRLDLYWSKSREGSSTALDILSMWPNPGTIAELRSYLPKNDPRGEARSVLAKLEVLASPDWKSQVASILQGEQSILNNAFDWAIDVMLRNDPSKFCEVVRPRLDLDYGTALAVWNKNAITSRDPSFHATFTQSLNLMVYVNNESYDDLLLAYWQAGGELKPAEKDRLATFGYACDPKQRLAELLASGK